MDYRKYNNDDEEKGFSQRYGFAMGIGVLVVAAVLVFAGRDLFSSGKSSMRKPQEITSIRLPPMPPPPPPPPQPKPPEQKIEQKMVEQAPVDDKEEKPDPEPQPQAPSITTNVQGAGGPDFGIPGGKGGSCLGWYAAKVQTQIGEALRRNARTRAANMSVTVRIWPDLTGRVTRASLAGTTGDPALDAALKNEILTNLQLDEAPPQGMPAPIVMRLTARRPQ